MSTHHILRRPPATAALVAAAAVLLSGCASVGPASAPQGDSASSARPVAPAIWNAPLPVAADAAALGQAGQWLGRADPLVPELLQAAQAASPTLSAAARNIEQARAARVAAESALGPQVDASASVSQARSAPRQPAALGAGVGVQAGWEIDLFGGRGAARDAAVARLASAQAQGHAARLALAAEVAVAYNTLRACEALVEQSTADARSREETARLTELSAKAGLQPPASAALARASAAQGRAQRAQQAAACELQLKALVALTAIDEPALRERLRPGHGRQPEPPAFAVQALPAALLERRPDLLAAMHAVQAAAADGREQRAADRPRISLSGQIGALQVRSAGQSTSGATWSIGPLAVTLPLLDGGRRAAQAQAAQATYDDAVVQLQAALRQAVREVEDSLVSLQSVQQREDDAGVAVQGFQAAFDAAQARWRGGLGSLYELEEARRMALAARGAWIELRRERALAWIGLYRAIGGDLPAQAPSTQARAR